MAVTLPKRVLTRNNLITVMIFRYCVLFTPIHVNHSACVEVVSGCFYGFLYFPFIEARLVTELTIQERDYFTHAWYRLVLDSSGFRINIIIIIINHYVLYR